jgi:hypothetical protein
VIVVDGDSVKPGEELVFADGSGASASRSWDFDDGSDSQDSVVLHGWDEEGTYDVRLRISNGVCERTATKRIVVSSQTTDVQDRSASGDFNLTVRPNPAHDIINVALRAHGAGSIHIALFDVNGRLHYESQMNGSLTNLLQIPLDLCPDGFYFVRATSHDKTTTIPVVVRRGPGN